MVLKDVLDLAKKVLTLKLSSLSLSHKQLIYRTVFMVTSVILILILRVGVMGAQLPVFTT